MLIKQFLSGLFILISTNFFCQSISKQVIGACGKTLNNSNFKISYTVGESVVGIMTAGINQLGNGYFPALNLQALSILDNPLELQLKVYPNPTTHFLNVSHPLESIFGITILDFNGKQLYIGIINKEEPLDVSNLAQGMYLITIESTTTNKKNTYKIIKK